MLDVRKETMKGKEEAFIDCQSLLHQSLSSSPESISALIHDLKQKENTKEKKKTTLLYTEEEKTLAYSSLTLFLAIKCCIIGKGTL